MIERCINAAGPWHRFADTKPPIGVALLVKSTSDEWAGDHPYWVAAYCSDCDIELWQDEGNDYLCLDDDLWAEINEPPAIGELDKALAGA